MHFFNRGRFRIPAIALVLSLGITAFPVSVQAASYDDKVAGTDTNVSDFEYSVDEELIPDGYEVVDTVNDITEVIDELIEEKKGADEYNNLVIVVDPGHDEVHRGASGTDSLGNVVWEEDLNLRIGLALYERLRSYWGVTAYITRSTSACPFPGSASAAVDNASRVNFAASKNADLYVACHLNTSTGHTATGSEVYYPNANYNPALNTAGSAIAKAISSALAKLGITPRGTKTRNSSSTTYPDGSVADYYTVIKNSKDNGFTGIIIEHCFMDNREDYDNFLSDYSNLDALGQADADGILNSLSAIRESVNAGIVTPIFDSNYYYQNNPDLQKLFSPLDHEGLLKHFESTGIKEGRLSSPQFSVRSYRLQYPELRAQFGDQWELYYDHYLNTGRAAGYNGNPQVTDMVGFTTVYDGVDYSAVYDLNAYRDNNYDTVKAFRFDDAKMIEHFVKTGMKQGLESAKDFSISSYFYRYGDLRKLFKKKWELYYLHYMEYGKAEGRQATGVTSMQNGITIKDGVDYKDVYDYAYYIEKYPDLKKIFNGDEEGLLNHFVKLGMAEGRIASAEFNVRWYKSRYPGLVEIFGDDYTKYFKHWMEYGKIEGREGIEPVKVETPDSYYTIMGTTNYGCTVDTMKQFFLSKAEFPEFYALNDPEVSSLDDFCRIYLEECAAEGVKAEVAFTQAMLETSYLRYTGTVTIDKYNFAGIGATSAEPNGHQFASVREGIRGHVQHLKAYASDQPLTYEQVDPRFHLVKRACAPYVEYLGIQENPNGTGWASQTGYGYNIMTWMRTWLNV